MTFEQSAMDWHLSLLKGISAAFLLLVAIGGGLLPMKLKQSDVNPAPRSVLLMVSACV